MQPTKFNKHLIICFLIFLCGKRAESVLREYMNHISRYFGYSPENGNNIEINEGEFVQSVPYEVSSLDEKFISEAVKLTGVAISELDSCQQRVVLKLRSDCNKMNDEQLAKMAVHLLNCQSYAEGRKMFPCNDEMSIKQCTSDMDSDTWTSYHLMSNRARAVCYMIRQTQFRGMAEHTVNRLMEASKDQILSLDKIARNQENILDLAENTYDSLSKGHEQLSEQQKDLQRAQLYGQLALENNIQRLADEKRLVYETHNKLVEMTREVQLKLENSAKMIANQNSETRINHKELLEDINSIQRKASDLFEKIDTYSAILLKQNQEFHAQYESTLGNLKEVNETVHTLVNLIGSTRQALEEKLFWLMTSLGGIDKAGERFYLVLWHVAFMLTSMLACVFLCSRFSTRVAVATLPPVNLIMSLYGNNSLDFLQLVAALGGLIAIQTLLMWAKSLRQALPQAIAWSKNKHTPTKSSSNAFTLSVSTHNEEEEEEEEDIFEKDDRFDETFHSLTPPVSRNGHYSRVRSRSNTPLHLNTSYRSVCGANTRAGTPCKLSSLAGRDFCYRHQRGDSILS